MQSSQRLRQRELQPGPKLGLLGWGVVWGKPGFLPAFTNAALPASVKPCLSLEKMCMGANAWAFFGGEGLVNSFSGIAYVQKMFGGKIENTRAVLSTLNSEEYISIPVRDRSPEKEFESEKSNKNTLQQTANGKAQRVRCSGAVLLVPVFLVFTSVTCISKNIIVWGKYDITQKICQRIAKSKLRIRTLTRNVSRKRQWTGQPGFMAHLSLYYLIIIYKRFQKHGMFQ